MRKTGKAGKIKYRLGYRLKTGKKKNLGEKMGETGEKLKKWQKCRKNLTKTEKDGKDEKVGKKIDRWKREKLGKWWNIERERERK